MPVQINIINDVAQHAALNAAKANRPEAFTRDLNLQHYHNPTPPIAAILSQKLHLVNKELWEINHKILPNDDTPEARFFQYAIRHLPLSCSQVLQDLWVGFMVEYELQQVASPFAVEFGATNGYDSSNTYALEKIIPPGFGPVVSLLAEPAPIWLEALKANRIGTNTIVTNELIGAETGQEVMFLQTHDPVLSTAMEFVDRDYMAKNRKEGNSSVISGLKTISLDDFLTKYAAPKNITYISVDTEGSEFDILSKFPFDKWNVALFSIEHNHTEARGKIRQLMEANGYQNWFPDFSLWDDWYVKKDALKT